MKSESLKALAAALQHLESGWNSADGKRFAEPFADDADFVDIRGEHHKGKATIAGGHAAIFASIYRGSRIKYEPMDARSLTEGVILGHTRSTLEAPIGPLAGTHEALASVVLIRSGAHWQIAAFHNTLVTRPSSPQTVSGDA